MKTISEIPFGVFSPYSKLYKDYLLQNENAASFYSISLDENKWEEELKKLSFNESKRKLLVNELKAQHNQCKDESTLINIDKLNHSNTFTITTGHQLVLLGGPLFFIYKIATAIALCKKLQRKFPKYNFVPVYWMASEDHDLAEINHTFINGKKYEWEIKGKGRSGTLDLNGLKESLQIIFNDNPALFTSEVQEKIWTDLTNHKTYAGFFRSLVEHIFKGTGLLIVDADCANFKKEFTPFILNDLMENKSFHSVQNTNQELKKKGYDLQVHPREINLFYVRDGLRERIEWDGKNFTVLNTDLTFTKEKMTEEVRQFPERFSPNVVLRPLYQQMLLPNFCYVGGPGELAYWLQFKNNIQNQDLFFPLLYPRFTALIIDQGSLNKFNKLSMKVEDLFRPANEALNEKLINEELNASFNKTKEKLNDIYNEVVEQAKSVDPTLEASAKAEWKKSVDGIENIEKKIAKAIRQKNESIVQAYLKLKEKFIPEGALNERRENGFIETLRNPQFVAEIISIIEQENLSVKGIKIISEN